MIVVNLSENLRRQLRQQPFHQFANTLAIGWIVLKSQRSVLHICLLIDFEHHGLIGERTVWGFRITIWVVDSHLIPSILKEIYSKFYSFCYCSTLISLSLSDCSHLRKSDLCENRIHDLLYLIPFYSHLRILIVQHRFVIPQKLSTQNTCDLTNVGELG